MRIVCIGGGPAGALFRAADEKADPAHDITVVERNRPDDTFGWGVVFSDQTLGNLRAADAKTAPTDPRRVQPLGRHRGPLQGPHDPLGRARLLRASAASGCSTSCRRAARSSACELVFETDVQSDDGYPTPT